MIEYLKLPFDVLLSCGDLFTYVCLPVFLSCMPVFAVHVIKSILEVRL